MIWEEGVVVIVMLTKLADLGLVSNRIRCDQLRSVQILCLDTARNNQTKMASIENHKLAF